MIAFLDLENRKNTERENIIAILSVIDVNDILFTAERFSLHVSLNLFIVQHFVTI